MLAVESRGMSANLCGWDSDAYLKRIFKKKFGLTMREWRAKNAGGVQ